MARVVVQRVRHASVVVNGRQIAAIGVGLLVLVGIGRDDSAEAVDRVADKIGGLRIFDDADGKMNVSTADMGGSILVVSQFTLYGSVQKGRRPSFVTAAEPEMGERLYERFIQRLKDDGHTVEHGQFGADMLVSLENNGPVTIIIDSDGL